MYSKIVISDTMHFLNGHSNIQNRFLREWWRRRSADVQQRGTKKGGRTSWKTCSEKGSKMPLVMGCNLAGLFRAILKLGGVKFKMGGVGFKCLPFVIYCLLSIKNSTRFFNWNKMTKRSIIDFQLVINQLKIKQ